MSGEWYGGYKTIRPAKIISSGLPIASLRASCRRVSTAQRARQSDRTGGSERGLFYKRRLLVPPKVKNQTTK